MEKIWSEPDKRRLSEALEPNEPAIQRRLHAALDRCMGTVSGDDPTRASRARQLLREKLARKRIRESSR